MNGLDAELTQWLERYFEAWNRYDVADMQALWDTDEPDVTYVAEECDPFHGWDAVLSYWGIDRSAAERLLTWHSLHAVKAGEDCAIAFFHANWSTYTPGNRFYPKPFGGPVRITIVLRRKAGEWRAIHYAESPEASLIQIRRAHEAAVDPRLHERLRAKGIDY